MNKRIFIAVTCAAACAQPVTTTRAPLPTTSTSVAPAAAPTPAIGAVASATIHDLAGARVGRVTFTETRTGLLVSGTVSGLGLGAHGIHIHAVGKCEPPFTTAGGHYNPSDRKHGFKSAAGPHLGDLPNIFTPAAGQMTFEFVMPDVTLKGSHALLDGDGASIVVHSASDDYLTDPAGNSGGRIACGVITATK